MFSALLSLSLLGSSHLKNVFKSYTGTNDTTTSWVTSEFGHQASGFWVGAFTGFKRLMGEIPFLFS